MFVAPTRPPPAGDPAAGSPKGDLTELPLEHLEHEITELASHIYAGTCRWLELVAEFDRREGWGSWGCRSCAEWISWRCAVAPRSAREHVRVARCLGELPRIRGQFARGALSYAKVRALTRVATADSEEELIELARHATAAQLERIVRGLRRVTNDEARETVAERYLVWWWEQDGSLSIRGQLPPDNGALLLEAIDAAHDALRERDDEDPESGSAEPPSTPRTTNADAMVAMAELSLGDRAPAGERSVGDRYQIVVHADAGALAHDRAQLGDVGRSQLDDGPALAPETLRRLACDSSIVPVVEAAGSTLSVGRKTRVVPPAIRRALAARDGRCRFPGCENRRFLDAHHIRHWGKGGETSLDNLIRLCRHHHRLVHEGEFTVEHLADGSVGFRAPDGDSISPAPTPPPGNPAALADLNRHGGLTIAEDTCMSGSGERFDLGLTVATLAGPAPET